MISTRVVELAVKYLDECTAEGKQATLVGMHWYIDGRHKTLPLTEELNEALTQRPNIYVQRLNGITVFTANGSGRTLTVEDMKIADKQYRKEFSEQLKKLKK